MSHTTLDPKYGDIVGFTRGGHRASVPSTPVMYVRKDGTSHLVLSLRLDLPGVAGGAVVFFAGDIELSRLPEPLIPPRSWLNAAAIP